MYGVSADYITAFHKPSQRWKIQGTVGNVSFTEANILTGSLSFGNRCSDSSDITLGMAAIGELDATFIGLDSVQAWKGKEITISVGLTLEDESIEYVPVGKYIVGEAKRSLDGVIVTAYDTMSLFDKEFTISDLSAGTGENVFKWICQKCGVTWGMDSLEGFCNDNMVFSLSLTENSDIKTYRDLIYWIAQSMCAFATIDRDGALVIRSFISDPVEEITEYERFDSVEFSDYETQYAGVIVENADGTSTYYGSGAGTWINLGRNPFFTSVAAPFANNLATAVQQIRYVPFSAELLGGIHFDLGDVVVQGGGLGNGARCIILDYDYTFNKSYRMEGYGANPALATAQSKQDKEIQGVVAQVDSGTMQYAEYSNTTPLTIGSAKTQVARLRFATKETTRVKFTAEIRLSSTADEETLRTICKVSYELNREEVDIHPIETWDQDEDGNHILTLMWLIHASGGLLCEWDVYMECLEGQVDILRGDVSAYLEGFGLVGDGGFVGFIEVEDEAGIWQLVEINYAGEGESVSLDLQTPTGITCSDVESVWPIVEITFTGAGDNCVVSTRTWSLPRGTQDGNIRATHNGDIRYTEGDAT